jgi:hypothetical protein
VQGVLQGDAREGDGEVNHACHWVLPTPEGPYAEGTCKICGNQKKFPNYIEEYFVSDYNARRERRELQKAGVR